MSGNTWGSCSCGMRAEGHHGECPDLHYDIGTGMVAFMNSGGAMEIPSSPAIRVAWGDMGRDDELTEGRDL